MAHRGGASEAPENSMPAFQNAVDLGYTYLETDVHVTADGVVVAFHDDDLQRTCGRAGRISELPWDEVATARIDGQEPIPRLVELFDAWPAARINIDCKEEAALEPLAKLIDECGVLDRVLIGSFSSGRMGRARRRLGAGVGTSTGTLDTLLLRFVGFARSGPLAAQVPVRQWSIPITTRSFVDRAHDKGLAVHVWTIDDADEMRRLLDLGVDGIMTDRPAILREVLQARGQWH
ncbi:MAG: glycerophosphodiester phosphodiesterase [Ilumatobacteraceae bacterium]